MKDLVESLRQEYDSLKSQDDELELSELKRVVKFRVELKKAISELEIVLESLSKASVYGNNLNSVKEKVEQDLKQLRVLKQTV